MLKNAICKKERAPTLIVPTHYIVPKSELIKFLTELYIHVYHCINTGAEFPLTTNGTMYIMYRDAQLSSTVAWPDCTDVHVL